MDGAYVFALLFVFIWYGLGIAAFITSLVCFGYEGKTSLKIIGLILSFLVGPFYWIYYYAAKSSYCYEKPKIINAKRNA